MYLDPGFGSMVIQMIVAAVAVGGSTLVIARSRVKAWFTGRGKHRQQNDREGDADHDSMEG